MQPFNSRSPKQQEGEGPGGLPETAVSETKEAAREGPDLRVLKRFICSI